MKKIAAVAASVLLLAGLAACSNSTADPSSPTSARPTESSVSLPENPSDVVGMPLDQARTTLEKDGWKVQSKDSYQDRMIVDESNWIVTDQYRHPSSSTVMLGAEKKTDEAERQASAEAGRKAAEQAAAAEAERVAQEAAKSDPATYSAIDERTWAMVSKDPNSYIGQKFVIYGHVTQFDSATGPDAFRANTSGVQAVDWYDFDTNTVVTGSTLGQLSGVVQDDLVKMYVVVDGSLDYDTAIGGTATAPMVTVNMIEVYGYTE